MQIHVQDGGKKVHIYSRNSEDMTPRYPDIVSRLPGWLAPGTNSIVIDGEAVAWDQEKNKILPFQVSAASGTCMGFCKAGASDNAGLLESQPARGLTYCTGDCH